MNIYIAARFTEKEVVKTLMGTLEEDGHYVTHDWTSEEDIPANYPSDLPEYLGRVAYLQECAEKCVQGVLEADVVLVLNNATGAGLFVEVGLAIAYGKKIVVVNPEARDIPFWYLQEMSLVDTEEDALLEINSYFVDEVEPPLDDEFYEEDES